MDSSTCVEKIKQIWEKNTEIETFFAWFVIGPYKGKKQQYGPIIYRPVDETQVQLLFFELLTFN